MNHPLPNRSTILHTTSDTQRIGEILVEMERIAFNSIDDILALQHERDLRFGEAARMLGLVSEADIQQALSIQFHPSYVEPDKSAYSAELIAAYNFHSVRTQQIRALRNQLLRRWFNAENKVLGIAGIEKDPQTSALAANLALTFSQLGKETLLIDANMYEPRQHMIFHLKVHSGLSDILAGRSLNQCGIPLLHFSHLSVLAAGPIPPDPQELFVKESFGQLRRHVANLFDMVLIDVPDFFSASGALELAASIDGIVLVVRKGTTKVNNVRQVIYELEKIGTPVVTLLLVDY